MAKKTAFDTLLENLTALGWEAQTHTSQSDLILREGRQFAHTQFVVAEQGPFYFFASDAPRSSSTGLYARIDLPEQAECGIFKKEWLDLFFLSGKKKSGVDYIDKNLTITSEGWLPTALLSPERVERFLAVYRKIRPMKLLIQNGYLPFLAPLKGEKVIGIETNRLLCWKNELEALLGDGADLIRDMQNSAPSN